MNRREAIAAQVLAAFARSPYRAAAEAAGFRFHAVEVHTQPDDWGYVVRGRFTCVCERHEQFCFMLPEETFMSRLPDRALDPAAMLYRHGSFSKQHLLADGYTEAQADEIVSKFNDRLRQSS